ncbi:MAG: hypothetical protein R3182_09625 [Draconibacterium sp.]|nr:hypothetical protein [Draconibacterium sp.]
MTNEVNLLMEFYNVDEIGQAVRMITEYLILVFACTVGVFIKWAIFPATNFRENVGFSLLGGALVFAAVLYFRSTITMAATFVACIFVGFFIPGFKKWFEGNKLAMAIKRGYDKSKNLSQSISEELDKLENEE